MLGGSLGSLSYGDVSVMVVLLLWFSRFHVVGVGFRCRVHHMYVLIVLSSIKVAEWPPFGKVLFARLIILSLYKAV